MMHIDNVFKDEAGRRLYAQLFRFGVGDFRSLQLRVSPLRTLTLGVLIVTGGTLAALPFRRYQAIPDASAAPAQVTGPTQSVLDLPRSDSGTVAGEAPDTSQIQHNVLAAHLPPWNPTTKTVPRERQLDIPLTFEDLSVPFDQPKPIEQRFSATAPVHQKQLERERVAALVMPAMETLAASELQELERVAESFSPNPSTIAQPFTGVVGSLASSATNPETLQSLPETNSEPEQRHWIRQPN